MRILGTLLVIIVLLGLLCAAVLTIYHVSLLLVPYVPVLADWGTRLMSWLQSDLVEYALGLTVAIVVLMGILTIAIGIIAGLVKLTKLLLYRPEQQS